MESKGMFTLLTDPQFRELIRPLFKTEYRELEESIVAEGCKEPIITWNGVIVDGHNRYEICTRYNIPFSIREADFDSRDEAVAWICKSQLQRESLPEEMWHYLIGKQYESEKAAYWRDESLFDRARRPYLKDQPAKSRTRMRYSISDRIAAENSVSRSTVEKYALYAKAIDVIRSKRPEMATNILSGDYKVSHTNVVELSKLSPPDLIKVQRRIEQMQQKSVKYNQIRNVLERSVSRKSNDPVVRGPSVKDMPKYDPDAEVVGLTLTIPTWIHSVDRVMEKTKLESVSAQAKINLSTTVCEMIDHLHRLLSAVEE